MAFLFLVFLFFIFYFGQKAGHQRNGEEGVVRIYSVDLALWQHIDLSLGKIF